MEGDKENSSPPLFFPLIVFLLPHPFIRLLLRLQPPLSLIVFTVRGGNVSFRDGLAMHILKKNEKNKDLFITFDKKHVANEICVHVESVDSDVH